MRELTIADIKGLENGEYIPSFCGTIEKVYEQKHGDGDYGAWSLQNMIVKDETGKVQVTWGGEDDLSEIEGQTRIFESSQTKHGLRGCRWEAKVKNGTRYEGVKLTDTCKIKTLSGGSNTGEDSNIKSDAKKSGMGTDQRTNPSPAQNFDGINEARQHIMQSVNLYNLCVDAVDNCVKPHVEGMTAEFYQAAVASLYIEASRRITNDGVNWWSYVDKMPTKPLPVHNGNGKVERQTGDQEESFVPPDDRCDTAYGKPPF